jgi:3-hydroxy-9,10-secoandrosta-1,3,5(10)-triene-9,17-dione monooxygenase
MAEVTPEDLIERARKLAPTLRERADKAGELRRTPDETIADFHALGLFKAVQPKRYGGYELNPDHLRAADRAGEGLRVQRLGVRRAQRAHLAARAVPPRAQDEVWGDDPRSSRLRTCPWARWLDVDGGYSLSGHWSFSSGCDHCEWILLGGFVPVEEGSPPDMRTFLLPRATTRSSTTGTCRARASGSKDIVVNNAFVPERHHMHKFFDGFRGEQPRQRGQRALAAYRYPFGQIHVRCVSARPRSAPRSARSSRSTST